MTAEDQQKLFEQNYANRLGVLSFELTKLQTLYQLAIEENKRLTEENVSLKAASPKVAKAG